MEFKHIYQFEPIDFWDKLDLADDIIAEEVSKQMPESPRDGDVYKMVVPNPPMLTEIYLCKADNNGTTYIFSNIDLFKIFGLNLIEY